jgi:hypothetical protein
MEVLTSVLQMLYKKHALNRFSGVSPRHKTSYFARLTAEVSFSQRMNVTHWEYLESFFCFAVVQREFCLGVNIVCQSSVDRKSNSEMKK